MNAVSKVGSYLIFILIVIVTATVFMLKFDNTMEDLLMDETVKFVDECRTTGMVDPANYRKYANMVYTAGNFSITIEHESVRSYPDATLGFRRDYYTHTNDEILLYMYLDTGADRAYEMKNGDILVVRVERENKTAARKLIDALFNTSTEGDVLVNYSGIIGNSNAG